MGVEDLGRGLQGEMRFVERSRPAKLNSRAQCERSGASTRHPISNSASIFIWSGGKPFCRALVSRLQPNQTNMMLSRAFING